MVSIINRITRFFVVASLVILAGCATAEKDWSKTRRIDTEVAYDQFITKWKGQNSTYVSRAQHRSMLIKRMNSAWPKLKIGMTMDEVKELQILPKPNYHQYKKSFEDIEMMLDMYKSTAEKGVSFTLNYKVCAGRGGKCVNMTNVDELEIYRKYLQDSAELKRSTRDFDMEFSKDRTLLRWRKKGETWSSN